MSPWGDLHSEMPRYPLDDGTVESVLRGAVSPDDAPPELRHVAALVDVCRRGAEGDELEGAELSVAAFAAAAVRSVGGPNDIQRRSMFKKLTSARMLAIAAPVVLLGAGSAAAASDALPAPAQSAVSTALAHLDVSVPNPDSHSNTTPNNANAKGPDLSSGSPAAFGLCTAFTHGGLKNRNSPAYKALESAAHSPEAIMTYCQGIFTAHQNATANPGTSGGSNGNGTGSGPSAGNDANPGSSQGSNDGTDNGSSNAPFTTPPVSVPPKGKPSSVPPSGVPPSGH